MKSGLEGRNNLVRGIDAKHCLRSLNEVRPRRPEQLITCPEEQRHTYTVSMKSGLEGRNNIRIPLSMVPSSVVSQ